MRQHLTLKALTQLDKMIIAYLGQSVKTYLKYFLRYLETLELRCPFCNGRTISHGSYERHIHISDAVFNLPIHRIKCTGCNKTHAVIPDFISPRKHYSAYDIEVVLNDTEDGITPEKIESEASVQTIRRWMQEYKDKLEQAAGALRALLFKLFSRTINELKLIGGKGFKLLEKIMEVFPNVDSSHLAIGEANLWLVSHLVGVFL